MPIAADRTRIPARGASFKPAAQNFDTAVIAAARPPRGHPAWATRDAGALVVCPGGRVVLWSPAARQTPLIFFRPVPYEGVCPHSRRPTYPADAVNADPAHRRPDGGRIAQV